MPTLLELRVLPPLPSPKIFNICDPLQENRPLTDFRKISVLGINRLEIYRRVQRSSYLAQNRFIRRVTALKLYTGSQSNFTRNGTFCVHVVFRIRSVS